MSLPGEKSQKEVTEYAEVDVHKVDQSAETVEITKGGIETDETDESDQIVFMIQSLPLRERRRTMMKLQPLMSSTMIVPSVSEETEKLVKEDEHKEDNKSVKSIPADKVKSLSASGSYTLSAGESTIVVKSVGNTFTGKLRQFSGVHPVPNGQVDFNTWQKASRRLCKNEEITDDEKIARIQNSLSQPALDLVQSALDSGSTTKVIELLEKAFGSVDDPRDLLNEFNASVMKSKEQPSDYLNRLYLMLEELKLRNIVKVFEGPLILLKQFVYGCTDESLVLKLRLEEKELNPPDYGTLLLALRREEAKRTRKQLAQKFARTQQVTAEAETTELVQLKMEMAALKSQFAEATREHQKPLQSLGKTKEGASACTPSIFKKDEKDTKKRLRFCFKCGADGHVVWKCSSLPNPDLVCKKFEDARKHSGN